MPRVDSEWVAQLRAGDDGASAELSEYLRRMLGRGLGRQLSEADLEDLSQEAMLRVHDKLSTFAGTSKLTTWAAAIAVNAALMLLRKRKHQSVSLEAAVALGRESLRPPEGPASIERAELTKTLVEAIDAVLSDNQREALLAELGGLPLMEVARRTNRSRGALYKMLHDARKKLRVYLEQNGMTFEELASSDMEAT